MESRDETVHELDLAEAVVCLVDAVPGLRGDLPVVLVVAEGLPEQKHLIVCSVVIRGQTDRKT